MAPPAGGGPIRATVSIGTRPGGTTLARGGVERVVHEPVRELVVLAAHRRVA